MSILIRTRRASNPDEENPYWMSFSDVMAGLLILFILITLSFLLELMEKKEFIVNKLAKAESVRQEILAEVREELKKRGIDIVVSDNQALFHIPEDQLRFESGEYRIPSDEKTRADLADIGRILYAAITRDDRKDYLDTIFIEGHTDSAPYRRDPMGNWGLSTDRAIQVWKYWTEQPHISPEMKDLKNKDGQYLFSVSGYSATRRVNTLEVSAQDRGENRRIDVRFTVFSPTAEQIRSIAD
jgi:flagellar motor protein MotB